APLSAEEGGDGPAPGLQALWVALAACASTLLLAFTSHMTLNIAAIPFLWVLPLALYLLSFVLCFEASGWYRRWLFLPLLGGVLVGLVAPNAFNDLYELPLGMVALCIFVTLALLYDRQSLFHGRWSIAARLVFLAAIVALGIQLARTYRDNSADTRVTLRNF